MSGKVCEEIPTCPAGFVMINNECVKEKSGTGCPPGTTYDENSETCKCPDAMEMKNGTCSKITCKEGELLVNNTCLVKQPISCPEGTIKNEAGLCEKPNNCTGGHEITIVIKDAGCSGGDCKCSGENCGATSQTIEVDSKTGETKPLSSSAPESTPITTTPTS